MVTLQYVSQEALDNALRQFWAMKGQLQTRQSSAWEAFLVGNLLQAQFDGSPTIAQTDDATTALFTFDSSHPKGRLKPFRYEWGDPLSSGRKTVWNVTTRSRDTLAAQLFVDGDIRKGVRPDAVSVLASIATFKPPRQALSILLARNMMFEDNAGWSDIHYRVSELLNVPADSLKLLTEDVPLGADPLSNVRWSFDAIPDELAPPKTSAQSGQLSAPRQRSPQIQIDGRLERMLRRAVAKYPFILLVGPPGTGKSTLVQWITDQVALAPEDFGFDANFSPYPIWKTPDESWSSFDLVGGLVPDSNGALSWSAGPLLESVDEDRWLVLDEINRADMDRIMGPLFTWLSGHEVEVGRDKPHGGTSMILGWKSGDSESNDNVIGASANWRLIGTYNPADAQRVFRMGQALSRRFVVIPVPAVTPEVFVGILEQDCPSLPKNIRDSIVGLYRAHHANARTQLGPAIFLRIASYFEQSDDVYADELLAESYVANVGKFLAAIDDLQWDDLGQRIFEERILTRESWQWVSMQREILS